MTIEIEDYREILLIMPLFYDVSKRNKLSFEEILNQNNDLSTFVNDILVGMRQIKH